MPRSDTGPTAEKAWRVANDLLERGEAEFDPPRADVFVSEYCDRFSAGHWEARAAGYKAVERGKMTALWYDVHVRIVPSARPDGSERMVAGSAGGSEGIESPWDAESFSPEALGRDAPELSRALLDAHGREAVFDRFEGFVECARFWDAVHMMDEHGIDATTAHAGTVVCRRCGTPVESHLDDHLSERSMTVDDYRAKYPAAPVTLEEAAALPPVSMDW